MKLQLRPKKQIIGKVTIMLKLSDCRNHCPAGYNRMMVVLPSLIFLLLPTLISYGDETNTLPVSVIAETDGEIVQRALKSDEPSIILVPKNSKNQKTHFVLVNPLEVSITYFGYVMTAWSERPPSGEISPLYLMKIKAGEDQAWKEGQIGWCGTGAGIMKVHPGYAGRFNAQAPQAQVASYKIGFECTWTVDGKKKSKQLWSPAVTVKK